MANRKLSSVLSVGIACIGVAAASAIGLVVVKHGHGQARGSAHGVNQVVAVNPSQSSKGEANASNALGESNTANAWGTVNSPNGGDGLGQGNAAGTSNNTGSSGNQGTGTSSTKSAEAQNLAATSTGTNGNSSDSQNSGQPAGPPPAQPGDKVTAVTANAASPDYVNAPVKIDVEVYNKNGAKMSLAGHQVTYQIVSGPSGASVTKDGYFKVATAGSYVIDVSVDGVAGNQVNIYEQDALQISVTSSNSTLSGPGQVSQVEAHVTSGKFHDVEGETVHFSVPAGSPIQLSSTTATTDVNGIASVNAVSLSGLSGQATATITASAQYGVSGSTSITVNAKPMPPAKLVPYAVPSYLTKDGAIISFTVDDANGQKIQGVTLSASATGATTKVESNNYGDYWVFVTPDAGATSVHLVVDVQGSSVNWTNDFSVAN